MHFPPIVRTVPLYAGELNNVGIIENTIKQTISNRLYDFWETFDI